MSVIPAALTTATVLGGAGALAGFGLPYRLRVPVVGVLTAGVGAAGGTAGVAALGGSRWSAAFRGLLPLAGAHVAVDALAGLFMAVAGAVVVAVAVYGIGYASGHGPHGHRRQCPDGRPLPRRQPYAGHPARPGAGRRGHRTRPHRTDRSAARTGLRARAHRCPAGPAARVHQSDAHPGRPAGHRRTRVGVRVRHRDGPLRTGADRGGTPAHRKPAVGRADRGQDHGRRRTRGTCRPHRRLGARRRPAAPAPAADHRGQPARQRHRRDGRGAARRRRPPDPADAGRERRAHLRAVADSGPGIAPGTTQSIFEDGWSTRPERGTARRGLGPALVHRLVQRHGGTITVGEGPGAVFTVVLPRPDAASTTGAPQLMPSVPTGGDPR